MRRTRPNRAAPPLSRGVRPAAAHRLAGAGLVASLLAAAVVAAPSSAATGTAPPPADDTGEPVITIVAPPLDVEVGDDVYADVTVTGDVSGVGITVLRPDGGRFANGGFFPDVTNRLRFDTRVASEAPHVLTVSAWPRDGSPVVHRSESYPIVVRHLPSVVALGLPETRIVGPDEPWATQVQVTGEPVFGRDVAGAHRFLMLERRAARGWVPMVLKWGRAASPVPIALRAPWAGRHELRLRALHNDTHADAVVDLGVVTRTRSYRPRRGTAARFARTPDGLPARFEACTTPTWLSYGINAAQAPAFGTRVARTAVAGLEAATGLDFHQRRDAPVMPFRDGPHDLGDRASPDLVVAWARGGQVDGLRGRPAIVRFRSHHVPGTPWRRIGRAAVVLNASYTQRRGFASAERWQRIAAHAMGRAAGLGVVDDPRQVMSPPLAAGAERFDGHYAAGDLRGLRAVGRDAGCIHSWRGEDPPVLDVRP